MDLFTYLMAKKGHNTSCHGDLFSYLLGKSKSSPSVASGTNITITSKKGIVDKLEISKRLS